MPANLVQADLPPPPPHKQQQNRDCPNTVTYGAIGSTVLLSSYIAAGPIGVGIVLAGTGLYAARKPVWNLVKAETGLLARGTVGCLRGGVGLAGEYGGPVLRGLWNATCFGGRVVRGVATTGAKVVVGTMGVVGNVVEAAGGAVEATGKGVRKISGNHPEIVGTVAATAAVAATFYVKSQTGIASS